MSREARYERRESAGRAHPRLPLRNLFSPLPPRPLHSFGVPAFQFGQLRDRLLQAFLPLNTPNFANVGPDGAFNVGVSFTTNTNWQWYSGESTLSNLSQMLGLVIHNFTSAATGIALAFAFFRGFARRETSTIGNFWADATRITLYVLLPICFVYAIFLIASGVPQTLTQQVNATTLEGAKQVITMGPVASQEAIKLLGTNGGGFTNANSAHPYENPTPLSNFLEMLASAALDAHRTLRILEVRGQAKDHPILLNVPESSYLKCVISRVSN